MQTKTDVVVLLFGAAMALAAFGSLHWAGAIGSDVNNDGHVRVDDILDVVHHYYQDVPTPTPGPPASVIGGSGNGIQGGLPVYLALFGGAGTGGEDESLFQSPLPAAGSVMSFYVRLGGPITSSEAYSFTIRRNGADTPVSCTIAALDGECSDTSTSAFFNAGDLISVKSLPLGGNGPATSVRWTAAFAPVP